MGRMGSGADVVMTPVAVEFVLAAADDDSGVRLTGSVESDANGTFYNISGRGNVIGVSAVLREGGTTPDDDVLRSFTKAFPDGVLIVVDPYAGEFAVYVSESGSVRAASAVMSE